MGIQLYIGNLSYRTDEKEVEEMFSKFGKLRYVSIKQGYGFVEFDEEQDADDAIHELHGKDLNGMPLRVEKAHGKGPKGPNREEGREGGYRGGGGYRDYDDRDRRYGDRSYGRGYRDERDRGDYYRSGGGGRGYDDRRSGAFHRRSPPQTTAYRLTVKNLSTRVSWQELKDMMRDCGPVTCADAHNAERNVGRVYFVSHGGLRRAIEKYQDMEINGRRIELIDDTIRRSRSPSPVRSSGRSPPPRKRSRARSFSSSGGGRSAGKSHSPRSPPKRRREVRRDDDSASDHSSPRRADDRDKDREERRADDRDKDQQERRADKDREERRAESPRDEGRK